MSLFRFGKQKDKELVAPTPQNAAPQNAAPQNAAPQYTAAQYVAAGHSMRASQKWLEALECYKAAAGMNDPEGLYWLANFVYIGRATERNSLLACELYSFAARMKHPEAKSTLFQILDAVIKDNAKSDDFSALAPFMKVGAEAGHVPSVYLYGYFLTVGGANLPQNKQEGYKWIKLAADSGYDLAQEALRQYF